MIHKRKCRTEVITDISTGHLFDRFQHDYTIRVDNNSPGRVLKSILLHRMNFTIHDSKIRNGHMKAISKSEPI